jgi:glycosyltransferase involved in cell wall biosynthesis
MRKKKLLVITDGNIYQVTSRVRAINYFEALRQNFDLIWRPRTGVEKRDSTLEKIWFAVEKRMLWLSIITTIIFQRFDIVFIQRLFLPAWILKMLKSKKTKIYFDFDDAIYNYSQRAFDTMMQYSDKVIVSTPFLEEYVKAYNKPCKIIFSPVDTDLIKPVETRNEKFTIGWIGSPWTVHYMRNIESIFQTLAATIPFKLLVMGAELQIENVDIELVPWSLANEIEALKRIDVGIMPLFDEGWANMKGGYKLFLYMAAGRPVVASSIGINKTIVQEGINGFVAGSKEQWITAFEKLYNDAGFRMKLGQNARKMAEDCYSYKVWSVQLIGFLNN